MATLDTDFLTNPPGGEWPLTAEAHLARVRVGVHALAELPVYTGAAGASQVKVIMRLLAGFVRLDQWAVEYELRDGVAAQLLMEWGDVADELTSEHLSPAIGQLVSVAVRDCVQVTH